MYLTTLLISIHALRVESDANHRIKDLENEVFQSTLSVWRATAPVYPLSPTACNFNPRSPCGERLFNKWSHITKNRFQSTLSVWRATLHLSLTLLFAIFQSTLSVWRATIYIFFHRYSFAISIHALRVESDYWHNFKQLTRVNFNPRSPCGERLLEKSTNLNCLKFQSTLSVWRATRGVFDVKTADDLFQSTLSVWRATW